MIAKGEVKQLNFGFRWIAAEDGSPIPSFSRQELLNTSSASKDETSTDSKISHLLNHG